MVPPLKRTIADAYHSCLGTALLCKLLKIVRDHTGFLDEMACPQLLHGNLWLFIVLIERTRQGPRIVGALDADRDSWGDSLVDWIFFLLERRASQEELALF